VFAKVKARSHELRVFYVGATRAREALGIVQLVGFTPFISSVFSRWSEMKKDQTQISITIKRGSPHGRNCGGRGSELSSSIVLTLNGIAYY